MHAARCIASRFVLGTMAANIHFSLVSHPQLLDIVDDEWARDTLPDDNIPMPKELMVHGDDAEDNEELSNMQEEADKWTDLGLNSNS